MAQEPLCFESITTTVCASSSSFNTPQSGKGYGQRRTISSDWRNVFVNGRCQDRKDVNWSDGECPKMGRSRSPCNRRSAIPSHRILPEALPRPSHHPRDRNGEGDFGRRDLGGNRGGYRRRGDRCPHRGLEGQGLPRSLPGSDWRQLFGQVPPGCRREARGRGDLAEYRELSSVSSPRSTATASRC